MHLPIYLYVSPSFSLFHSLFFLHISCNVTTFFLFFSFSKSFPEKDLVFLLLDLFFAGSETTTNTLMHLFYYLAMHPNIQKKLQAEIDEMLPKGTLPTLDDRPRYIWVTAMFRVRVFIYILVTCVFGCRSIFIFIEVCVNIHCVYKNNVCWM